MDIGFRFHLDTFLLDWPKKTLDKETPKRTAWIDSVDTDVNMRIYNLESIFLGHMHSNKIHNSSTILEERIISRRLWASVTQFIAFQYIYYSNFRSYRTDYTLRVNADSRSR